MKKELFGKTKSGETVNRYEISNSNGMKLVVSDYGATVLALFVKDKDGSPVDVALGYEDFAAYEKGHCYLGSVIGRCANRISNAKINIDGVEYKLEANDNENCLHSGSQSTALRVWNVKSQADNSITFEIEDADLQEGYPGNAVMTVTYEITDDNGLVITYTGKADKTTPFNFTNHTYFNLNGHDSGDVYKTMLQIEASHYTPVKSSKAIPTGELAPVAGTPFDFTTAKAIGQDINADNEQLKFGNGYDHNFAIDRDSDGMERAATAVADKTGIRMEVFTDTVGIQFYSANFIDGQPGKGGVTYHNRNAFCLETQYFPNSVNEPNFKTPITKAGEEYRSQTEYRFSVQ